MMKIQPRPAPPLSIDTLQSRAQDLAGMTLGQIARHYGISPPVDLKRHKGWVGQLLEYALGADAASLAEPDFQQLAIELKTIPIDHNGLPKESTYVCSVPMGQPVSRHWEESWIRRKLSHVLWIPYEAARDIPLGRRRIGPPLLWKPDLSQEEALRRDWEELMALVTEGGLDMLNARVGEYLQIRPKAANSRVTTLATADDGTPLATNPRGFYLRPSFTRELLRRRPL